MFKSARIIMIVCVMCAPLAFGCSDGGGGGGGSSTEDDATDLCEEFCDEREPEDFERCEEVYFDCIEIEGGVGEECEVLALASCGGA
jgi:hypothetical protein